MKTFSFALSSLIFLSLLAGAGCKNKTPMKANSAKSTSVPLIGTDNWQGKEDSVDPKVGVLKTLD